MKRRDFITLLGGAAAWPLAARAQQTGAMRRIGVLMAFAEGDREGQAFVTAFRDDLRHFGWIEGRNIRIDRRWATADDPGSIPRLADELVALEPDLILSHSTPTTAALLKRTRTIPIIFAFVSDPLGSGFVAGPAMTDVFTLLGRGAFFRAPFRNSISSEAKIAALERMVGRQAYSWSRSAVSSKAPASYF
jgi:putative tryptophan/tyrosine transport system substrate-binding protein